MSIYVAPSPAGTVMTYVHSQHLFSVGGEADTLLIDCYEKLNDYARAFEVRNDHNTIDLNILIDSGRGFSEPFHLLAGDPPLRMHYEDGVHVRQLRIWSESINGVCTVILYPGLRVFEEPTTKSEVKEYPRAQHSSLFEPTVYQESE